MNDLPEDPLRDPATSPANEQDDTRAPVPGAADQQPLATNTVELSPPHPPLSPAPFAGPSPDSPASPYVQPSAPSPGEPLLFQSFVQPVVRPPARIPHFGHLCLLAGIVGAAYVCMVSLLLLAVHFHLFGLKLATITSTTNIRVILASETVLYLFAFAISFAVFPLLWHERFFTGVQWRGAVALERFWALAAAALGCAALAAVDEITMPGPKNAPIEEMLRAPGAAWLMFGFGITIAPFSEELLFRGFLLPSLCTAWDWAAEKITGSPARLPDTYGHPQWSLIAMIAASILTSIPFALLHVAQQGHALGPFLLLIVVSLVLCAVRLKTRSLAASTLVHSCYNFIIFSIALIGSSGFRHFDKM
jgi:membrane protease YdiL (CAAX protease family)